MDNISLCKWLRENSSGDMRLLAVAANRLEACESELKAIKSKNKDKDLNESIENALIYIKANQCDN